MLRSPSNHLVGIKIFVFDTIHMICRKPIFYSRYALFFFYLLWVLQPNPNIFPNYMGTPQFSWPSSEFSQTDCHHSHSKLIGIKTNLIAFNIFNFVVYWMEINFEVFYFYKIYMASRFCWLWLPIIQWSLRSTRDELHFSKQGYNKLIQWENIAPECPLFEGILHITNDFTKTI